MGAFWPTGRATFLPLPVNSILERSVRRQDARHDTGLFSGVPVWLKLACGLSHFILAGAVPTQMADMVCGLDRSDFLGRGSSSLGCHYQAAIRYNRLIHSIYGLYSIFNLAKSIAN